MRPPLITQEFDLQAMVAGKLKEKGIPHQRERRLGPGDTIDFLAGAGVGIECKKGKPNRTRLEAQLTRYCRHPAIGALILVVPWQRHLHLPGQIEEKPIHLFSLNKLWGIAT